MALRGLSFSTRIRVLFQRPILFILGLLFMLIGTSLTALIYVSIEPEWGEYSDEEYLNIVEHGDTLLGQVYSTEIEENIEINGKHPVSIYYEYLDNDSVYSDYFRTLDNGRVRMLDENDEVVIFKYQGKTVLGEFKPFQFPRWIIAIVPGMLGLIGTVLFVIVLIKSIVEFRFLRTAEWKTAKLTYLIPQDKRRFLSPKTGLMLHYEFESNTGYMVNGYSFTFDIASFTGKIKGDEVSVLVSKKSDLKTQVVSPTLAAQNGWEQA